LSSAIGTGPRSALFYGDQQIQNLKKDHPDWTVIHDAVDINGG
jgi:hypothetical protein